MYIQLTTRCNMTCAHCCSSCGRQGTDMSMRTYQAALKLAASVGEFVVLGGGEPTLHPKFWTFLGLALGASLEGLWLATNGKIITTALALAGMAQKGVLGVALSQDPWHDPIDERVVQAFTKRQRSAYAEPERNDLREIRTVTRIVNQGRAKENSLANDFQICACDELSVDPGGTLWSCGCQKVAYGTVFAPKIPQIYWDDPDSRCRHAWDEDEAPTAEDAVSAAV